MSAHLLGWGPMLALLVLSAACGGASVSTPGPQNPVAPQSAPVETDPSAVRAQGDTEVVARVGRQGGNLALSAGIAIEIPPGALTQAVEITFRPGHASTMIGNREGERPVGPMLELSPAVELAAGKKATISMPLSAPPTGYEPSDLALAVERPASGAAFGMRANETRWDMIPTRLSQGRLSAELDVLYGLRVMFIATQ